MQTLVVERKIPNIYDGALQTYKTYPPKFGLFFMFSRLSQDDMLYPNLSMFTKPLIKWSKIIL
jgi:hypothetical protein